MPACEECHRVKVKCDQGDQSCSRCQRLEIPCIGRISRQGQGPKKRRRLQKHKQKEQQQNETTSLFPSPDQQQPDDGLSNSEDRHLMLLALTAKQHNNQDNNDNTPFHHYGVRYMVHSWTSFAFARKSFSLLSRASRLAAKCNIPMDEVYCSQRRHILDPLLYNNDKNDKNNNNLHSVPSRSLQWGDLPSALLEVCKFPDEDSRHNRFIMVREADSGHSRYLVTESFQERVASPWLIEQTWKANKIPVVRLFLEGRSDFDKFTMAVNYQLSRYTHPEKKPECFRFTGFRVKFKEDNHRTVVKDMDLLYTFHIVTLEQSFYILELVHPTNEDSSPDNRKSAGNDPLTQQQNQQRESSSENRKGAGNDPLTQQQHEQRKSLPWPSPSRNSFVHVFDELVPLEDLDDGDFDTFLELLNSTE